MLISALVEDQTSSSLDERDITMLKYVVKLTHKPASISGDNIEQLSTCNFDHLAIHDICAITAYFGFVNRIADGLGVELEARFKSG